MCVEDIFYTSPTDLPGPHGLTQRFLGSRKWCWELGGLGTCSPLRLLLNPVISKVWIGQCESPVTPLAHISFGTGGGHVTLKSRAKLEPLSAPSEGGAGRSFMLPLSPATSGLAGCGDRPRLGRQGPDLFPTAVAHTGCGRSVPFLGFATALLLRVDLRPWTGHLTPRACTDRSGSEFHV